MVSTTYSQDDENYISKKHTWMKLSPHLPMRSSQCQIMMECGHCSSLVYFVDCDIVSNCTKQAIVTQTIHTHTRDASIPEETIHVLAGGEYLSATGRPDKLRHGTAMRSKELKDLGISALLLALAFGIALSGGFRAFFEPWTLVIVSLMAIVGVSLGFVLHEMGHRFVARRFGYFAEYTMWRKGLILALVCSLFGFVFAAPGAVMIHPRADVWGRATLTREKTGLISIAGPAMNICLAVVFILINVAYPMLLFSLGARINTWLAIFNLIPFGPLDGAKIFRWNKKAWLAAIAMGIGLFATEYFVL